MVIMHDVEQKPNPGMIDIEQTGSPYVYLVDNEEKMMLILKNDFDEIRKKLASDQSITMQEYITDKVQTLLNRVNDNGPLSIREMEVLRYAAMGKSNKQIAETIGISESTVKNHFSSTLRKLNANDRTHAVILAVYHGWLNVKNLPNLLQIEETSEAAI
jgi:DNA-binding CsgD family transcriptional regulator